ncbi:hypothetical protein DFH27DRAFT_608586 [Peziza echinospora]|nr:hypothetical protein DFH27DRAFT_608586 [Peziza echinospora]
MAVAVLESSFTGNAVITFGNGVRTNARANTSDTAQTPALSKQSRYFVSANIERPLSLPRTAIREIVVLELPAPSLPTKATKTLLLQVKGKSPANLPMGASGASSPQSGNLEEEVSASALEEEISLRRATADLKPIVLPAPRDTRPPKNDNSTINPSLPGIDRTKPIIPDPSILIPPEPRKDPKELEPYRNNYLDLSKRYLRAPQGWSNDINDLALDGTLDPEPTNSLIKYILSHPIHSSFPLGSILPVLSDNAGNYLLLGLAHSEDIAYKEQANEIGDVYLGDDAAVYFYNAISGVLVTVAPALAAKPPWPETAIPPWVKGADSTLPETVLEMPKYEGAWSWDKEPKRRGVRSEELEENVATRYTPQAMAERGGLTGVLTALGELGFPGLRVLDEFVTDREETAADLE